MFFNLDSVHYYFVSSHCYTWCILFSLPMNHIDDSFLFEGTVVASAAHEMERNQRRVLRFGFSTSLLCNESVIRMV